MASDFENKDDAVTPGQDPSPAQEAPKPEGKPEGGAMTMTINGSYSRDSYEATTAMDVAGGREGGMKMRSHSESHRVGQCKGDEINAKEEAKG